MIVTGKYNSAKVFTDDIEESAIEQIKILCDQKAFRDSTIRIMPDVHAGAGCVIGFTADFHDMIIPNLVGVDIACGVRYVQIKTDDPINFDELDDFIRFNIPHGFKGYSSIDENVHSNLIGAVENISELIGMPDKADDFLKKVGTLGGGNHFIEMDRDTEGNHYLIVHSGSRNFGHSVAQYFQKLAVETCPDRDVPDSLKYLTGESLKDYVDTSEICRRYASVSRMIMLKKICDHMGFRSISFSETVHNIGECYSATGTMMIRKGAIRALENEPVIIPLNMRDGSILGRGKGNQDWNWSGPHGAGRILSRKKAKHELSLDEYKKEMTGIYSSCISPETLDESPMAYKDIDKIISHIHDTVEVESLIHPVYNFKAS